MKFYSVLVVSIFLSVSASANPVNFLKREIKRSGYILYTSPLSSAGTGTLVGGSPNAMSIVADPQTCFPDAINGESFPIRKVEQTNLGSLSQTTSYDGQVAVDLLKFMGNGNSTISVGLGFDQVQSVELQFEGATVEYIDTILLQDFYQKHMTQSCKKVLNSVGFIIQALRVEKMKYAFKQKGGGYLKLTLDNLSEYVDIDVNAHYHIEQDYILVIDTPKYIGYQLGRLQEQDQGLSLYRAQSTLFNRYRFKSISVFQN